MTADTLPPIGKKPRKLAAKPGETINPFTCPGARWRFIRALAKHVKMSGQDDCWEWTGTKTKSGYGKVWYTRRRETNGNLVETSMNAHRAAWFIARGPIPDGVCVCHHCDNPTCCNPRHLFLGTHLDNARDRSRKGRSNGQRNTHCVRGHKFTNGLRVCPLCKKERDRQSYLRHQEARKKSMRTYYLKNKDKILAWQREHWKNRRGPGLSRAQKLTAPQVADLNAALDWIDQEAHKGAGKEMEQ